MAVIHYVESYRRWPICPAPSTAAATRRMSEVTCKRCLAILKKAEVIK